MRFRLRGVDSPDIDDEPADRPPSVCYDVRMAAYRQVPVRIQAMTAETNIADLERRIEDLTRSLSLQHAVARVLAETDSLAAAVPRILSAAGANVGWDVGSLWMADDEAGVLRCLGAWQAPGVDADVFLEKTRSRTFELGIGLPGRVWQNRRSASIDDVRIDQNFPRAPWAAEVGLQGGVAVPILFQDKVTGVFELFSRGERRLDGDLLRTFESIGDQLGQYLERLKFAAVVRESEERFALAVRGSAAGLWDWNVQTNAVYYAPRFKELLGFQDGEMANVFDSFASRLHPDDKERVFEAIDDHLKRRIPYDVEYRLHRKDGSYGWFRARGQALWNDAGEPTRMSGSIADVGDRKEAERRMLQSAEELKQSNEGLQHMAGELAATVAAERDAVRALKDAQSRLVESEKLVGLGQLVAGVAHEINNPLAFVSNNVAVLQRDAKELIELLFLYREAAAGPPSDAERLAERIRDFESATEMNYTLDSIDDVFARTRDGLKRIQQIVKDLRDFARIDQSDLQEADLNAGIESTVNILQGRARTRQVSLVLELQPLPPVFCYGAKINQVVMNLASNAIDACPPNAAVTIRTRQVESGVEIQIEDTGTGIAPAVRERIFDPFFTTKPLGQGTGLGLSISYGIVQDHGGRIDVYSTPGQGSRFVVGLPVRMTGKGG